MKYIKSIEEAKEFYRRSVVQEIVDKYRLSFTEAEDLVSGSSFLELLNEDPEFVGHYDIGYWVGNVVLENYHLTGIEI